MAVTKVDFLEDKVRIYEHFKQPSGVPNDNILDIPYDSIRGLERLPKGEQGEEIFVPKCNQTIVLVERSSREPATFDGCRLYDYETYLK